MHEVLPVKDCGWLRWVAVVVFCCYFLTFNILKNILFKIEKVKCIFPRKRFEEIIPIIK